MNQRKTYLGSNVMINMFYCLFLLTSIVAVTLLVHAQDRFVQASLGDQTLENQTFQSTNQAGLAASQESIRVGTFGDDRITGTNQDDIIIGLLGSDTINGDGGNDKIQGNEDSDKIYGDEGNDILQGGVGSDQIFGRAGDDVIVGGIDDDYLVGDEGSDKIYGSEGDDILIGGLGADYFDCGEGTDVVVDFNISENDDNAGNCEEIIGTETISIG
ncbi:MAG TPA: calcium-binding protein [Nitrososphaeraceae archaeon]|nr:calcium-binding protein [Nitrososphaeraceae archaeon]